jgi:hypothetical protein
MNQYQQRAEQLAEPVDLNPPPKPPEPKSPPKPPKPKSGGPGTGTLVGVGALVGGGALGGLIIKNAMANQAPDCTLQETAAMNGLTAAENALNSLSACGGNTSCWNARIGAFNSAWSSAASAIGNWCTCLGPSAGSQLSASDKAAIQQIWPLIRSMGLNPGTLPSCFQ